MPVKITLNDVLNQLNQKNFELLNISEFKNTNTKGLFKCKIHNIEWKCDIRYTLKNITYCHECKQNQPKYTLNEVLLLQGFKLLNKLPDNCGLFECLYGHQWKTKLNNISLQISGCSQCYRPKITLKMVKDKLTPRGYILLDEDKFKNTKEKGLFKCKYNHIWKTEIYNVYAERSGCPDCSAPLCEKMAMFIFNKLFNTSFYKTRNILPSKLELDGYNKNLKLAFEYNGIQHYSEHKNHFHKKDGALDAQIKRDQLKIKECQDLNITLIIIPYIYNKFETIKDYIIYELDKLSEFKDKYIKNLNWKELKFEYYKTWETIHENPEDFIKLKKIIEEKNGKCLSDKYVNTKYKLQITCEQNHIFEINSNDLLRNRWCYKCAHNAPKTKESINDYLKEFNLLLLDDYIKSSTKYHFQCNKGHISIATWDNMKKYTKTGGCRICKNQKV